MSARCPQCDQPGIWTASSGLVTDGEQPPSITDTYQCGDGHEWTSTTTYE